MMTRRENEKCLHVGGTTGVQPVSRQRRRLPCPKHPERVLYINEVKQKTIK